MWQARLPFEGWLCWILMTVTMGCNVTVYATIGSQSVLRCPLSSVINNTQWLGPPGDTPYNLLGTTILNHDELPADFVSRLAIHPTTGALIINNTQRSDESDTNCYICKTTLESITVKLSILVSPQPPFIDNSLEDNGLGRMVLWAMEDSQVRLVCQIKGGNPHPSVKWIRDGLTWSEVAANNSEQINTNGTYDVTATTTVTASRSEDRVKYVCQANHTTWTSPQNASVELYLYLKPKNPVLSEQVSLQEGGNLSVTCSVTGCRPTTNLTWTGLQGQQIQTNTWIPDDETYSVTSLYTTVVGRQENGVKLMCTVIYTTIGSSLNASTTLRVWFPPTNVSIKNNRNVTAGRDTLTLVCTTGTSNPVANITWSNGTSAATGNLSSKREQSGAYGGKILSQNLTIIPTRYMDGSNIMCSAQNSLTSALSVIDSVILSVMYNPVAVISNEDSLSVKEGDTNLALACVAESKPVSSFMWVKDTMILQTTGPKSDNKDTYTISRVDRTHYGEYSCVANNSISPNGQGNIFLDVLFPPTSVSITNNRNVTAGPDILILRCTTGSSNPIADITWRNGTNVITGELSIKKELSGTYGGKIQYQNLTILPSRHMNGNTITCSARNSQTTGPSISDRVTLNIRYGPDNVQITPVGDLSVVEGTMLNISCSAECNPVCDSYRWQNGSDNSSLGFAQSLVITKVRREHAGVYYCNVTNSAISNSAKVQVNFTVNYAPDVLVDYSGSSLTNSTVLLTCTALGEPSQYTFHEWVHKVGETEIRRQTGENFANMSILTLPNISIEDMGTYVCTVDNSITGWNGRIKQTGHTDIFVRGTPFIENKDSLFIGTINKSARIEIPFYSNPSLTTVKFYRGANNVEVTNTSDTSIVVSSFLNTFTFYGKEVLLNGQIAVLHFRTVKTSEYGKYTAVLFNDIGNTSRRVMFTSGEPETPANFHVTDVQEKQVTLQWLSGYHMGFDQTFVVQISMDNITWTNASVLNAGKTEGWFSATITGLKSNTPYYFRLYSFNVNGEGDFAEINFVTRTLKESASSLDIGASLGIGFGGFFLGVVGTISVIIVRKRIAATPKYKSTSEADMPTDMQTYANTRVSSSPAPSHYEELQHDNMEKTMYDRI